MVAFFILHIICLCHVICIPSVSYTHLLFVIGNLLFICHIGIVKLILLPVLTFMGGVYSMMLINYLDSDLFSQPYGLSFGFVERIVTFFLLYKYASRLEQKSCINRLFINTAYMYLLLMVYCSDFSIFIDRVAAMFRYFYWILIPLLLFGKERISYHKVLISFYLLFFISRTIALTAVSYTHLDVYKRQSL